MRPTRVERRQRRSDGVSLIVIEFASAGVDFFRACLSLYHVAVSYVEEPPRVSTASSIGRGHKVPTVVGKVEQWIGAYEPRTAAKGFENEHRTGGTSVTNDASRQSIDA